MDTSVQVFLPIETISTLEGLNYTNSFLHLHHLLKCFLERKKSLKKHGEKTLAHDKGIDAFQPEHEFKTESY